LEASGSLVGLGLQTLFPQFRAVRRRLSPGRSWRRSSPSAAAIRWCCCRYCCRPSTREWW